jgi:ethanolamine utilization protein EutA
MEEEWITSVGIDLGTSTTKWMASSLRVAEISGGFALSRYEIVERKLIYTSPVVFTPLLGEDAIDAPAIMKILREGFDEAGLQPERIKSGAVIITGETATKSNAQQMVHLLAGQSGTFVVASAGPDLEGIMAGKGSGAQRRSLEMIGVIANVDVGGGTSNVALFHRGEVVATLTFHVGGRLLRMSSTGLISYISPHLMRWLKLREIMLIPGMKATVSLLRQIAAGLCGDMLSFLQGDRNYGAACLCIGLPPVDLPHIDEVMYSGGVAQLMEDSSSEVLADIARFGDFGPMLSTCLADESRKYGWRRVIAEQTARATVIGAGMQSLELSGSTVYVDEGALPVRNVPILKVTLSGTGDWQMKIQGKFSEGQRLFNTEERSPFALSIKGDADFTYANLRTLAQIIGDNALNLLGPEQVVVVICEQDMSKALGQLLALHCRGKPKVVCIDQVNLEHGDYIDIGELIAGRVVPVIVKTLVFPSKETEVMT